MKISLRWKIAIAFAGLAAGVFVLSRHCERTSGAFAAKSSEGKYGMNKVGKVIVSICVILVTVAAIAGIAGCGPRAAVQNGPGETVIAQIGSTTLLPLAEKWHEAFGAKNPGANIMISGGGSGAGIKAMIDGTTDIADASREITDKEIAQAKEKGIEPVEHLVAYDGIAIVVHPSNQIEELSIEQLSDIYTGAKRDWSDFGGNGGEIQIVSRDSASGTYESFKELVVTMDGQNKSLDYAPESIKQGSNQSIMTIVGQTKGAIGYIGLGYINESVKVIGVIPIGGDAAVSVDRETIQSGAYPVSRALYCYTADEPKGMLKEYLAFIKGPEGQAIVEELGFVAISE